MGLDDGGIALSAFDHIRIDRSLRKDIHLSDSVRFFLKDADELFPDDLPFLFRFTDPFQSLQETLLRIDADQIQSECITERLLDSVRFSLS